MPSYCVCVCWYITWLCDFNLWPFCFEQFSCMTGHVINLATKCEDPTPIRSWVTSYNASHWVPLKMRTRPLSMRRITWPVSRVLKQLHIWTPQPRFAYSLYNFYWATTTIKVVYSRPSPMVKPLTAYFLRDLVTLTCNLLTLNSCRTWRVTWPTLPPNLKTLRLFFHELRVITVPIDYHWKCVRGHCACAESRDPWVGC